ncbi:MAG: tetratricopeptide repeat protein [Peptococcaceae bacterium]|nr:tetratricopeptide repeat protein [Peptococcaceae bacterium]
MKTIFLFSLVTLFTGNPLLALAVIILIYVFIDRRFIGILPDFTIPWRRRIRIGDLERTIGANPHNGDALLELGRLYFGRKQYRRAVDVLERAYEKMKDWPDVHFYLGAASYEIGGTGRGLAEIREAVEINPKTLNGFPYIYLIRAILEGKDTADRNTDDLERRLLRFGSVQAFFEAGKLFFRYGEKLKAGKFFREVLDNYRLSSPTFRRTYRRMAIMSKFYLMKWW